MAKNKLLKHVIDINLCSLQGSKIDNFFSALSKERKADLLALKQFEKVKITTITNFITATKNN